MFGRIVWKMLRGGKGRMLVALLAIASGAAVISALLNVQFDMQRKLAEEFRTLGANIVIAPPSAAQTAGGGDSSVAGMAAAASPAVLRQDAEPAINATRTQDIASFAPFLFLVSRVHGTPVVVAGTWLDQLPRLNPTWKLDGSWVAWRADQSQCLVGRSAARQFDLRPGSQLTLTYLERTTQLHVAGIVDSGAAEDDQIFVSLPIAKNLAGISGAGYASLWQLSVTGTSQSVAAYAARLAAALPFASVQPIRAVTEAEGNLLHRTRLLVASMVALILVLTALCVLATMAALAMERREDVGLMKALGGSIARIVGLFLAEVSVLGAAGGLLGSLVGIVLAQWIGERVFDTSIAPRWEIFPLTIAMMVVVALAGALPLRLLGKVKPAVILRGE
ncbi:MAG TPA: FtsX-like permease family protein [Candidatus Acidoferrales bacterium]|jgi:putative ABC transport system permease protein|nr:FtsX-like permease family protein [Candidatus Acidoferrales bacterium]